MSTFVALLRGVNVGAANRVAMPALRDALTEAGFAGVRTHLQSGNIVLSTRLAEREVSETVALVIGERCGLRVPVVVRTGEELARVVAENPFPEAAELAPKRYQVTFFSAPLGDAVAARLRALAGGPFASDTEAVSLARSNRNAYGWHPDGIHSSKLARELSDHRLGVTATARNWTTVLSLLGLAAGDDS
ncbi:MAG: DUF1697 domain-containing protein [Acidobacteriota bacterium]|nr:DUF1697 domain-containing protein [Acidobacteriota bacterium]